MRGENHVLHTTPESIRAKTGHDKQHTWNVGKHSGPVTHFADSQLRHQGGEGVVRNLRLGCTTQHERELLCN